MNHSTHKIYVVFHNELDSIKKNRNDQSNVQHYDSKSIKSYVYCTLIWSAETWIMDKTWGKLKLLNVVI